MVSVLSKRHIAVDSLASGVRLRPLRSGIVGAGLMGTWHAHALRKTGATLVGVADMNAARALSFSKRWNAAQAVTDVHTLLDTTELDVLHICSPLDTHFEIAEHAIRAGVNLIIEKPITPTAIEALRLFEAAAGRGVSICPVHQFLFQRGVLKAKELLNRAGRIVHMSAAICSAGGNAPESELDGIASDTLPHPISLMELFFQGDLETARWTTQRPGTGEIRAFGETNDTTISLFVSMHARPTRCEFELIGTLGTVYLDLFHGYAVFDSSKPSRASKLLGPFARSCRNLGAASLNLMKRSVRREYAYPGLEPLITGFYRSLSTGTAPPLTVSHSMSVSRLRDRLLVVLTENSEIAYRQTK
jgi:predicted dehydrogenase